MPDITYSYVIIFRLLLDCLCKVSSEAMKNPNVASLKYFLVVGVEPPVVPVQSRFWTGIGLIGLSLIPGTGLLLFLQFFVKNCKDSFLIGVINRW